MNNCTDSSKLLSIDAKNASVPFIVTMHADTSSSDTRKLFGPTSKNKEDYDITYSHLMTTCSTILIRRDGNPMILGTTFAEALDGKGIFPIVMILDKGTGKVISNIVQITAGNLLGGVYAYLDIKNDRLWMADGNQDVIYIESEKIEEEVVTQNGHEVSRFVLHKRIYTSLKGYLVEGDGIVSLSPDKDGDIWFVSAYGVVGIIVHSVDRPVFIFQINKSQSEQVETINNSFSTAQFRDDAIAAVATNYALYLFRKIDGKPICHWRKEYDRGTKLKPGQLAYPSNSNTICDYGTGSTPTFFGPVTGAEYVTITNNSDNDFAVIVRSVSNGEIVCQQSIFPSGSQGTENASIAFNNTVIVSSTYGYTYPVPSSLCNPRSYPFYGGLVCVHFKDGDGKLSATHCWDNQKIRSVAVPQLSLANGLIYTITKGKANDNDLNNLLLPENLDYFEDFYWFTGIDYSDGSIVLKIPVSEIKTTDNLHFLRHMLHDPLQMAGALGPDGTFWQGTMGGVFRIVDKSLGRDE